MNPIQSLQQRLAAKLKIKNAHQSIKTTTNKMKTLKDLQDSGARVWEEAKTGKNFGHLSTPHANEALKCAVAELNALKAGKPAVVAVLPSPSPTAAKPAPTAAKPVTATPAPTATAPAGTVTAAAFAKPKLTISRAEFNKLSHADRSRFCAEGGRIIG